MTADASPPRPPRRRYPHSVRREQLTDVAERLFIDNGYAAVTMEDIARTAGVTRPVVYNHFQSKEGAYLACVERALQQHNAEMLAGLDASADPREQLAKGAEVYFGMLERDPGRWSLVFGSGSVLPGTYADQLARLRFTTIDTIAEMLRRVVPQLPQRRIQAAAHAISGVGERLGHWWRSDPSLSRAEIVEYYTDILWSGLRGHLEERPSPPGGGDGVSAARRTA
ncbi:TetR/AcrR family transcriptional regulator [Actinomadura viridis]|uniref:AcrR family transcriptional regulator n=1 Tax=Actinomadura viridis TaxID=58110 RepID=A0A931DNR4_9ACTN|nr:TetR/AcrR family transcriptional regulator [Actinomadura viridis]MBG6092992.1 AcrR family transcriptional regulator [Actinomadura viridis]